MTTHATIDTPWTVVSQDGSDSNAPKLPYDPAFEAAIQQWVDVTGEEGVEVEPGKVLYGGNYAKSTGIQPDYSVGRLGGSGDPDWLMIKITFDEVAHPALLDDIDANPDYNVYYSELVIEEETP